MQVLYYVDLNLLTGYLSHSQKKKKIKASLIIILPTAEGKKLMIAS